jgi:hypothetical protein
VPHGKDFRWQAVRDFSKNLTLIPSNSVQNPLGLDVGYGDYKGQGYKLQAMEIYCDKEIKPKALNLTSHLEVEPIGNGDAHALVLALESIKDRGLYNQKF